jgi:flagellar FliL protein
VGVVLALFVVRPMMSKSPDAGQAPEKEAASHDAKDAEHQGETGAPGSTVYSIKDIVVNPASTGGTRFLSVSFAFELSSAALVGEFESKELAIRDALITILSAKTVAQLTDPKEKEIVRYQIRKRISDILKTDQLAQVYYTDFVLQ